MCKERGIKHLNSYKRKRKAILKNSSYKQPAIYLPIVVKQILCIERLEIDLIKG